MAHAAKMQLPYSAWPDEDRKRWNDANQAGQPGAVGDVVLLAGDAA